MLEFAESGHPVFRSTSPLSRGVLRSKGGGKLSVHYCADPGTIETVFRTIISVNQLSLYGAVAEMCEEYESLHDRSGQPDTVMGQSIVLNEIKTEVPLENDDPAYQNFVLQQSEERIERLTQQDKVSGQGDEVPKACSQKAAWQKPPARRAARKGKWPPRGTGTTVLTYPGSAPRGTGKAGENG